MNSKTPFLVPDSTTLRSLLEGIARQHPELPAVLDSYRPPLSFAGLLLALQRIRKQAQDAGLRQGERVAVCHERPADMAIWLAALSDGLECIPLPKTLSTGELSSLTGNLKPRAVLVNSGINPWAAREKLDEEIKVLQIADWGTNQWKWRLIGKVRDQAAVWRRATEDSIALILMTSGSTASPKLVPVLHRAISLTITESARSLALQAGERCLNFMPLSHVHGLVSGAYLPWVAGCCSVMPGAFRADDFIEWLGCFKPNWFSTSPTIFADILRRSQTKGLPVNHPALRFVRCGSAALHETRAREIESAFQVPLIEAYGMSETLQIAGVPFAQQRPGSVGRSLILEIGIFDPQGRRLSPPDQGEILLKGPSLMPGYLGGAEPRDGFVGEWFKTGDLGYLDADGFLFVTGRVREVIISGGENISPGEIEACLSTHPNVSECCVFGLPHPTLGESLGAAVVPNGAATAGDLPDDLQQYLRRQLPLARIPKRIFVLNCLPLLGNGKVDRKSVVQQCVTLIESGSGEHLIDPLEAWLQTQFTQVLQLDCVAAEDDFFALGGSSLDAMELLVRLRELLGVTLHPPLFLDTPTVRSLAQLFRKDYPEEIVPITGSSAEQPALPSAQTPTMAMHLTFAESLPDLAGALPAFTAATASPVFILSAPRCGSTLLRVMLAGHPQVFAPPELRLLAFSHMGQWMAAHSGRFTFFREGLLRALMTAFEWPLQRARSWLENAAEEELPVEQVYEGLQAALGDRLIIDKTPLYALSLEVLSSITSRFTRPRFVVLWRNPVAMKRSYTDARMDQLWMHSTDSTPGQLAELIWYRCYANIDHFLETADPARVLGMHFETLVTNPQECAESLCEFLEIPMDPELLNPYGDHGPRMTEGVESGFPMIGDPRFFDHESINPERAAGGLEIAEGVDLSEAVRGLARGAGYGLPAQSTPTFTEDPVLSRQRQLTKNWSGVRRRLDSLVIGKNLDGQKPPIFWCCQSEHEFQKLAVGMGPGYPVYGMRSGNLMFTKQDRRVLLLARSYAEEILSLRLHGPIVLGGNCQGAHVAYHIAQLLVHKQQPPAMVFLMEASFDSGLAVPVALIYGKNSPQHNPFLLCDDPKPHWSQLYPDYSVDQISGGHGEYFNDQNLPELLSVILKQLRRIDATLLPRQQQAGLLAK